MSVRVTSTGVSLERVTKILGGVASDVRDANYNAMKRAGEAAKTKAGQLAAAEYTINKGTFMSATKQKMVSSQTALNISFAGSVLPLLQFNTVYGKHHLLRAQVLRKGGGGTLNHAFTARLGGRLKALERLGKYRTPLESKYGPSTAHMMQNETVVDEMHKVIQETYDKRIEHEITRILNRW